MVRWLSCRLYRNRDEPGLEEPFGKRQLPHDALVLAGEPGGSWRDGAHGLIEMDARPLVTSVIIRTMCGAAASGRSAVIVTPVSVKLSWRR